jgi:uncharacterized damage-inducible protein DinB
LAAKNIPLLTGVLMNRTISTLVTVGLAALLITFASAQEKKPVEPPTPAQSPSQELLNEWYYVFGKVIAMARDFPQDKYDFKAQKDQRTFGQNLVHIASAENNMMSAITGTPMWPFGSEDSLQKKYTAKDDIVKFLIQTADDGAKLIKEQGDSGLTREFKYPWGGNWMIHGSALWNLMIEHTGEHFGQLVVYYRVNGMIPPESRPKK